MTYVVVTGRFIMGKRTNEVDIIAMALLYRKEHVGTDMISYTKAIEFDRVINKNLDKMEVECGIGIRNETSSPLYRLMSDENGIVYAVINPMSVSSVGRMRRLIYIPL